MCKQKDTTNAKDMVNLSSFNTCSQSQKKKKNTLSYCALQQQGLEDFGFFSAVHVPVK